MRSNAKESKRAGVYLFWSVMTTAVSWVTYTVCMLLLDAIGGYSTATAVFVANGISWLTAVLFSFTVNKLLVFKSRERSPVTVLWELVMFFSTRIGTGLLEVGLVPIVVMLGWDIPLFGIDGLLSKCLITPILIVLNYLCGKFVVFKGGAE